MNAKFHILLSPFCCAKSYRQSAYYLLAVFLVQALLCQSARSQQGPPPGPGSFGAEVLADSPLAYWQLNETGDPSGGTLSAYDFSGNGLNGVYRASAQSGFNNILGPQPPAYPGFALGHGAALITAGDTNSAITLPPLNVNTDPAAITTNGVTIAMWINPSANVGISTGLLMHRVASGDGAGFRFGNTVKGSAKGMANLGYTWNHESPYTWGFNSSLFPLVGVWQFAVLVVSSNSATIYLDYIDPITGQPVLNSAVNNLAHNAESFSTAGLTVLGADLGNGSAADTNHVFPGAISDAAIFNYALTSDQVLQLFAKGAGLQGFPPQVTVQPYFAYVNPGSNSTVSVTAVRGTLPFTYQWQLNGTNVNLLTDSANFTGANSNILSILSANTNDTGLYRLIVTNNYGATTSSVATLAIQSTNLVGEWLAGESTLTDMSGHTPAGTHDAFIVGAGHYVFTNDTPNGIGQSLCFNSADTGLVISNSSTLDPGYTNTFDAPINSSMTVSFWARGLPGSWNPWVSKNGETAGGASH